MFCFLSINEKTNKDKNKIDLNKNRKMIVIIKIAFLKNNNKDKYFK